MIKHRQKLLKLIIISFLFICIFSLKLPAQINMYEIQELQQKFIAAIKSNDWQVAEQILDGYLNSENFNSHTAGNIVDQIMLYPQLLSIAEKMVVQSIKENTIENLRQLGPEMANNQNQNLDYSRFYSRYAWILWKKGDFNRAQILMDSSLSFLKEPLKPDATQLIRSGIIRYFNHNRQNGWDDIKSALLLDTQIENKDPDYFQSIQKIVKDIYGKDEDVNKFLASYRKQNMGSLPDMSLTTLENEIIELKSLKDKVLFINFFSPICGSCRQEIPNLKKVHDALKKEVVFLFILNNPGLKDPAIKLFKDNGYNKPLIATINEKSAWDYILVEPTIWLVDKDGKIAFKHLGYRSGEEFVYQKEMMNLLRGLN